MSAPRRLVSLASTLGAVALVVAALSGPASAGDGDDIVLPPSSGDGDASSLPGTGTGATGGDGGDSGTRGGCAVVAGPSYLGVACSGAEDRDGKTVKEILGDDPVPGCWDDAVSETQLAQMGRHNEPGPDGHTWYWERCLSGIDKQTKKIEPGGIKIDVTLVSIPNGDNVKTLTANQASLVRGYEDNSGVPAPLAGVTPSSHPHVGQWVSFVDSNGDAPVEVVAAGVTLRARLVSIDVEPLGPDQGETVSCPGAGVVARAGDTPDSVPDGCWYKYLHSSADQPDEAYPVRMTAHWTVDTSVGGAAWEHFTDFTKSQVTNIPVTEVQTLVVD